MVGLVADNENANKVMFKFLLLCSALDAVHTGRNLIDIFNNVPLVKQAMKAVDQQNVWLSESFITLFSDNVNGDYWV